MSNKYLHKVMSSIIEIKANLAFALNNNEELTNSLNEMLNDINRIFMQENIRQTITIITGKKQGNI